MKNMLAILGSVSVVAFAGGAFAQETINRPVAAPRNATEIGVGVGYSQPAGNLTQRGGDHVADIARGGGEVNAEVGYRLDPRWLIGIYGGYGQYHAPNGTSKDIVNTVNAGVQAQYHLTPFSGVDPWVSLGVGYRGFFQNPRDAGTRSLHGLQLAKVRIGADYRVTDSVALGPLIGMDLTMFTSEHRAGSGNAVDAVGSNNLTVTPFFFAGVGGKFDLGGEREREARMVALRY